MQVLLYENMQELKNLVIAKETDPEKFLELCSGLSATDRQSELDAISQQLSEIKDMIQEKNKVKKGRDLAKQDKKRALEDCEIELDWMDETPFARGGNATVHMARYGGVEVVAKQISLEGLPLTKREKIIKKFVVEIAIMTRMR